MPTLPEVSLYDTHSAGQSTFFLNLGPVLTDFHFFLAHYCFGTFCLYLYLWLNTQVIIIALLVLA